MSKDSNEIANLAKEYNKFQQEIESIKNNKSKKASIGQRIKAIIKRCDLTDEDFAEIFDVDIRTVSKWYNGERTPEIYKLLFMACYFNVSPYLLITGGSIMINNYTTKIVDELCKIKNFEFVKTIHDFKLETDTTLPHLILTEDVIKKVKQAWENNMCIDSKLYAPYIAQVIIKYAYNRSNFKKEFDL